MIDKHILPELGKRRVADVEFSHIDALRTVTKSGSPIAAKIALSHFCRRCLPWRARAVGRCAWTIRRRALSETRKTSASAI